MLKEGCRCHAENRLLGHRPGVSDEDVRVRVNEKGAVKKLNMDSSYAQVRSKPFSRGEGGPPERKRGNSGSVEECGQ